jgi:hypothetical protein
MSPVRRVIASAFLIAIGTRAGAQANRDSIERRDDCRFAAQVVSTGHPASWADWAFAIIGNCGSEGIQAFAGGIASMRSSVDTGFLASLSQQARYYRDGGIFAAALSVAGDPAASELARVYALLTMQGIIRPRSANTYAEATTEIDTNGEPKCTRLGIDYSHQPVRPGVTPLPADYEEQVEALARRLQADAGAPPLVRAVAHCPF